MRKFECNKCKRNCKLEVATVFSPEYCVFVDRVTYWHEVKEEACKVSMQDNKLLDWVKVGEWFYRNGKYHKFSENMLNVGLQTVLINEILKGRVVQARKRPFNAEEMNALVGKVVTDEDNGNSYLINQHNRKRNDIKFGGVWLTNKVLMNNANYTIDGKPCYKLEHLENGEWVE